ncbi:hypothetical protein D3C78_1093130 [compost metagenome]
MLTGNHQQMHGAGGLQDLPVGIVESRTVAQHQRRQGALATARLHRQQAAAQVVPPAGRSAGHAQALAGLDRAAGADAPGRQPGFVIEGMRIDQPARALEAHRQTPDFAGGQRRRAIPGQAQALRQLGAPRLGLLQIEAHHAVALLRQADDLPLQPEGLAIQLDRQTIVQRQLCRASSPRHAEKEQAQRR